MGSGVFRAFRLARYVSSFSALRVFFSEAFDVTDHTVPTGRVDRHTWGTDGRSE